MIFDGTSKNIITAEKLGCKISSNFDGSFAHPCREGKYVFTILDACHMIKLARNAFADKRIFYNSCNEPIKWDHVVNLNEIQKRTFCIFETNLKTNTSIGKIIK